MSINQNFVVLPKNYCNSQEIGNDIRNCDTTTKNLTVTESTSISGTLSTDCIDTITATTLKLGPSLASKIEVADTGITTEVQGLLDAVENITTNEIDTRSATTLFLGKSTANKVEIADTGITTEVQGALTTLSTINTTYLSLDGNANLNLTDHDASTITTGEANTIVGEEAGKVLTEGFNNTCFGFQAGKDITTGDDNTCIGSIAGVAMSTGDANVCIGKETGPFISTGSRNIEIGYATNGTVSGTDNISIGTTAGFTNSTHTGIKNTVIGNNARNTLLSSDYSILIGSDCRSAASNTCTIGGDTATNASSVITTIQPGTDNTCDLGTTSLAYKDLYMDGVANVGSVDARTATTLTLGASTADRVEIADAGIVTDIEGSLNVDEAVDLASSSGITTIGSSNALTISADGVLDVNNTFNATGAVNLATDSGNDLTVSADGLLDVTNTTTSSSSTTGSAKIGGGLGVAENIFGGGTLNNTGATNLSTSSGVTTIGSSNALTVAADGTLDVNNTANFGNTVILEATTSSEGGEIQLRHGSGINNNAKWSIDSYTAGGTGDPTFRIFGNDKGGINTHVFLEVQHNGASALSSIVRGTVDFEGSLTVDDIDTSDVTTLTLGASRANRVEVADAGIVTDIEGSLNVDQAVDLASSSGITTIGSSDAVTISAAGVVNVPSGDLTVLNETAAATATLLVEAKGDAHLWLKSDNDNQVVETEHPIIALSQDAQQIWSTIGYDNAASSNNLVIRAGNTNGASADILFYVDGNSSGAMTSPRGGLNTGDNIFTLTASAATVNGKLEIKPGTGAEGGELQIFHRNSSSGRWLIDSDGSDRLRIYGTDPADGTNGSSWLLLDHNTTNNDATMAGGFLDINMTGDITIDTTDTTDGIKIGTVTSGVPISIGHTTSETTVNDNLTVTGILKVNDIDPPVFSILKIGELNATKIELADPGVPTEVQGSFDVFQACDLASSSGITTIGSSNALTVSAAGVLDVNNTTASTSTTTGCAIFDGGIGVAKDSYFGGDVSIENISDCTLWVKADTNNITETDDGNLLVSKDGQLVWATFGFDNAASGNDLIIRAGNENGTAGNIEFWTSGDSGAAVTDISDTQGASNGTNVLRLTEDEVEVSNELKLQRGTVTQLTSITTSVTVNAQFGAITTVTQTFALASNYAFTVNNNYVTANSTILLTLNDFDSGKSFHGIMIRCRNISSGSFDLHIYNALAVNYGSANLTIGFMVMNDASI